MRVSARAGCAHSDVSTVSRQVSHLVTHGLLAKLPDPDDRRAHRVTLTDEGRAYVAAHPEELARVWEPFDSPSSEERDPTEFANLKPKCPAEKPGPAKVGVASRLPPAQRETRLGH